MKVFPYLFYIKLRFICCRLIIKFREYHSLSRPVKCVPMKNVQKVTQYYVERKRKYLCCVTCQRRVNDKNRKLIKLLILL